MRKWMENGIRECFATVSSSHMNTFRARQRIIQILGRGLFLLRLSSYPE